MPNRQQSVTENTQDAIKFIATVFNPLQHKSSAGSTTGIELALYLVAEVCAEAVAARVAQVMVMVMPMQGIKKRQPKLPFSM